MQVFKFGGASVKDASRIKNMLSILKDHLDERTIVVVSALGKTTNALEDVVHNYLLDDEKYLQYLREIREYHITVAYELFEDPKKLEFQLFALFDTVEHFCTSNTDKTYNFVYDQIVSIGEIASTKLVSEYANSIGLTNNWLDARKLICTNTAYTDARVDWALSEQKVKEKLTENSASLFFTQGFIGGTEIDTTTTLGREGSDFSAAILAYCSDADKLVIWKDVPGVLNADPKEFKNTVLLEKISYREAIEMTYYGAKVIHPKTIRPLQNKQIPLFVRSFVEPETVGTTIHSFNDFISYPPIIVRKRNQILLSIRSKDFSFIAEDSLARIFKAFDDCRLRINMMHTGAISFSVSIDNNKPIKIEQVKAVLSDAFEIIENTELTLLTIRHYTAESIEEHLAESKEVMLEQKTRSNVQFLCR